MVLRRLPSNDYHITTLTENSRIELENETDWLQAFAKSAEVKRTTFAVFAHGIKIKAVDASNQARVIETIRNYNSRLHPELDIVKVTWMKRTLDQGKSHGSLIIETSSTESANRLISQGLVFEGEIKNCERFIKEARITQCLRCQKYGHLAKGCQNIAACAHCAGPHHVSECPKDPITGRHCALCKGNHPAWSRDCQYRRREFERTKYAKQTTPALYAQDIKSRGYSPTQLQTNNIASFPTFTTQNDPPGWQQATRGRRGRPKQLESAARASDQTRINTFQRVGTKRTCRDASLSPPPSAISIPSQMTAIDIEMTTIPSSAQEPNASTPTNQNQW